VSLWAGIWQQNKQATNLNSRGNRLEHLFDGLVELGLIRVTSLDGGKNRLCTAKEGESNNIIRPPMYMYLEGISNHGKGAHIKIIHVYRDGRAAGCAECSCNDKPASRES